MKKEKRKTAPDANDIARSSVDEQLRAIKKEAADIKASENEAITFLNKIGNLSMHQIDAYLEEHPLTARQLLFLLAEEKKRSKAEMEMELRTEQARKNANKAHAAKMEAKKFVQGEWDLYENEYKGNKSAFARHYAQRVKYEKKVAVTIDTIRDRWLPDLMKAKKFVQNEWKRCKNDYKGNKSYFASDYGEIAQYKFGVDMPMDIIQDRWLKGL